jgi:hypothetical protein
MESIEQYSEFVIKEQEDGWLTLEDIDTVETGEIKIMDTSFTLIDKEEVEGETMDPVSENDGFMFLDVNQERQVKNTEKDFESDDDSF